MKYDNKFNKHQLFDSSMKKLQDLIEACTKCSLHKSAKNKVISVGSFNPKVLFVGEAPGVGEDEIGIPFIGPSGKLLNNWIVDVGLKKEDYAITNVIKCHPPNNRNPLGSEINACSIWLREQIRTFKPKLLVAIGRIAKEFLVPGLPGVVSCSGNVYPGIFGKTLVIFHPAYSLRNGRIKPDLSALHDIIGLY